MTSFISGEINTATFWKHSSVTRVVGDERELSW